MDMENIFLGKVLLVDLDAGTCEEEDLDEDLVEESLGGAAVNLALYEKYSDRDPVVSAPGPSRARLRLPVVPAWSPGRAR